jgi:hypothetical protein
VEEQQRNKFLIGLLIILVLGILVVNLLPSSDVECFWEETAKTATQTIGQQGVDITKTNVQDDEELDVVSGRRKQNEDGINNNKKKETSKEKIVPSS